MEIIFNILTAIFSILGIALFKFQGWILIALYLLWQIFQNKRKTNFAINSEHIMLQIIVPKTNDKKELSAEQMFASLHGILRPATEIVAKGTIQEHISFEIASENNLINFYAWVPTYLKDYVESQIYAQYPTVQIVETDQDYSKKDLRGREIYGTEIGLIKDYILPIKTFPSFEVDPLAGITTVLAKLEKNEEIWIQYLIRPIDDKWHKRGLAYVERVKHGTSKLTDNLGQKLLFAPFTIIQTFLSAIFVGPSESKESTKTELTTGQTTINTAVETKAQKIAYEVKIRTIYIGTDDSLAKQRIQALLGGFKQFNTTNLNGFGVSKTHKGEGILTDYRARLFDSKGDILNIEELASLYHLPHTTVETPNIAWINTKVGEPPANLPTLENTPKEDLNLFGVTTFRQGNVKFGIKRSDRARHLYVIGKSGVGKSFLLQLLVLSDIYHNKGFAVVDPHGDLAQDVMKYIPKERVNDVVYFNPADIDYPISFNPMENADPNMRSNIASEIVGVLKKMFESWGPRLEHILRFTLLALLETPDATLLGLTRMLTDKEYRKKVIGNITDPVVKSFWVNEFAVWNDKFANEAVAPVLNKVGHFTANPLVRNVLGQVKSSFDIRELMDKGKILIVDLSRGRIGEDNAGILGSLIITKIQLAAMSRADMPLDQRLPFYLYVDEFQLFATDSFAVILSEARKYGLYLTVANQYVAQMPEEVKDAVFGNVGSMITFTIGAADATYLAKYFEPVFEPTDLVNLNIQNIYVAMSIDRETTPAFSAKTLRMPEPEKDLSKEIIENSRKNYSANRVDIEKQIIEWSGLKPADNQGGEVKTQSKSKDQQIAEPQIPTVSQKPNLPNVQPKKYSHYAGKHKSRTGRQKTTHQHQKDSDAQLADNQTVKFD
ncbi:MAG: type IV secretion system DNA-binding domain-containing protein [bacterium]|nr:type IV secretion system DNA-binding domain-containing protein [bacterium]